MQLFVLVPTQGTAPPPTHSWLTADSLAQILPDPKLINSTVSNPHLPDTSDSGPASHGECSNLGLSKTVQSREP